MGGIIWCRSCSVPIFRTINKYTVTAAPSTDIALEPKTFFECFLLRVTQSSRLVVPTSLGHVSQTSEEFLTSVKRQTLVCFQLCAHGQRGSLLKIPNPCNVIGLPTFLHKTQNLGLSRPYPLRLCNNSNLMMGAGARD